MYEDPFRPGYSEIIIDDGSGSAGGARIGSTTSGTVPLSGALTLWHESPATTPIDQIKITRGASVLYLRETSGDYVSAPERGLVYLGLGSVVPGDVWEIGTLTSGDQYRVYTGLVSSLQAEVEGSMSAPATSPGWRAIGTRVRVRPPRLQEIGFDLHVLPDQGVSLTSVSPVIKDACVAYLQTLAPGETLYVPRLYDYLLSRVQILTVRAYVTGTLSQLGDVSAQRHDYSIRTIATKIGVIPAPEE